MKDLFDRQEIAKSLNFGKYPVLALDTANRDSYGLVGVPCRIDMGNFSSGEKFYEKAEFRIFKDECKPTFTSGGCCLANDYGYSDFMDDMKFAQAPIIKPNSEFVFVLYNSVAKAILKVCILKTGKTKRFCITPIECEDLNLTEYI